MYIVIKQILMTLLYTHKSVYQPTLWIETSCREILTEKPTIGHNVETKNLWSSLP